MSAGERSFGAIFKISVYEWAPTVSVHLEFDIIDLISPDYLLLLFSLGVVFIAQLAVRHHINYPCVDIAPVNGAKQSARNKKTKKKKQPPAAKKSPQVTTNIPTLYYTHYKSSAECECTHLLNRKQFYSIICLEHETDCFKGSWNWWSGCTTNSFFYCIVI